MGGGKDDVVLDCVTSFGGSTFSAGEGEEAAGDSSGVNGWEGGSISTTSCIDTSFVIGGISIGALLGERERRRLRRGPGGGIFSVSGICSVEDAVAFCVSHEGACLNLGREGTSAQ